MESTILTLCIKAETAKAILVYGSYAAPEEDFGLDCWLPKSQVSIVSETVVEANGGMQVRMAEVEIPTWLTRKNTTMLHDAKAHYAK